MKLTVVKEIVGKYSLEELTKAENDLMEEKSLDIEISGEDEGEQLTHIIAAIWILKEMEEKNIPLPKALRNYTQRVRNSIS
jgi:hypothetical protein